MIVVRNVFELKFGKAKEAIAVLKEGMNIQKRVLSDVDFSTRLSTDVTGRFYRLVLEITVPDLTTYESTMPRLFADPDWHASYQKMAPLVESGRREMFRIIE